MGPKFAHLICGGGGGGTLGNGETGGAHDEVKCVLIIAVAPINPPAAFGPGGGAHTMYDASGCIGGVGVTSNTGGEYAAAFK